MQETSKKDDHFAATGCEVCEIEIMRFECEI